MLHSLEKYCCPYFPEMTLMMHVNIKHIPYITEVNFITMYEGANEIVFSSVFFYYYLSCSKKSLFRAPSSSMDHLQDKLISQHFISGVCNHPYFTLLMHVNPSLLYTTEVIFSKYYLIVLSCKKKQTKSFVSSLFHFDLSCCIEGA